MNFDELFANVCEALEREQRISYRALRRRFELSDKDLEDLKVEIIKAKQLATDEDGEILVSTGDTDLDVKPTPAPPVPEPSTPQTTERERAPASYTPAHLTEKILTSKSGLEGERKVVTVLFADIKDSTDQLLFLVNYRPEYTHGWGSKTYYTQLRLDPLPPESADKLLEALLGNDASLASLKQPLIERTEGNLFFTAIEMYRDMEMTLWLPETEAALAEVEGKA